MSVLELPAEVLVAGMSNRAQLCSGLHSLGNVFRIANTRHWLVVSYEDAKQLLELDTLAVRSPSDITESGRSDADSLALKQFAQDWVLYQSGAYHNENRRKLARQLSRHDLMTPVRATAKGTGIIWSKKDSVDLSIEHLSHVSGIARSDFDECHAAASPLIDCLQGRKATHTVGTEYLAHSHALWFQHTENLCKRMNDSGGAIRSGSRTITPDELRAYLLPFLDVVEPFSTLISASFALAARRELDSLPASVIAAEAVRLNCPFQCVRRQISDSALMPAVLQKALIGDTVSIMVSVANRDPKAFRDPDNILDRGGSVGLAFGHGTRACLGARIILTGLTRFVDYFRDRIRERANSVYAHEKIGANPFYLFYEEFCID